MHQVGSDVSLIFVPPCFASKKEEKPILSDLIIQYQGLITTIRSYRRFYHIKKSGYGIMKDDQTDAICNDR